MEEQCLLTWEKRKTEVFTWSGTPGLTRAGCFIDGEFEPGFLCYGVPVGTDRYIENMLEKKIEDIARAARNSCDALDEQRQFL